MPCSIAVCESGPCRLGGSDATTIAIEDMVGCLPDGDPPLAVLRTGCLNLCGHGPNAVLRVPGTHFHTARRLDRFRAIMALVQRGLESVRPGACLPPAHILKSCELHWTAVQCLSHGAAYLDENVHANYDQALQAATQGLAVLDGCETADCSATSVQPHKRRLNESEPTEAGGDRMGAFSKVEGAAASDNTHHLRVALLLSAGRAHLALGNALEALDAAGVGMGLVVGVPVPVSVSVPLSVPASASVFASASASMSVSVSAPLSASAVTTCFCCAHPIIVVYHVYHGQKVHVPQAP